MQEQENKEEKNYYIVLPITMLNIQAAYSFIELENANFLNIGDNRVFEIIPNPNNNIFPCYRIELKESLAEGYRLTLESLGAEIYESAEAYLEVYQPIKNNEDNLISL